MLDTLLKKVPKRIKREVELRNQIALAIHEWLKTNELKQAELAEKMDISESRVSYILTGEANLTLRTIAHLEEVLDRKLIEVVSKDVISPALRMEVTSSTNWPVHAQVISMRGGDAVQHEWINTRRTEFIVPTPKLAEAHA